MRRTIWAMGIMILCMSAQAKADSVTLTDGETLQGTLVEIAGGVVHFKSDTLGVLSVPVKDVASLTTKNENAVVLNNGTTLHGTFSLAAGGKGTVSQAGQSKPFGISDVSDVLPEATYQARLAGENAKLWQSWKGGASAGYNLQQGAQKAHSLALNVSAVRKITTGPPFVSRWSTDANLALLFASTRQDGIDISSNTMSASLRENYSVAKDDFLFVLGQADHIETQNLYLRQTYGGGIGRELLNKSNVASSVLGGLTFVKEKFSGTPADQYAEALIGETLHLNLSKTVKFDHYLHFYPNLSSAGDYRFDTSAMFALHVTPRLTGNLGATDFYASHVAVGSPITVIGPTGALLTLAPTASKNNFALAAGVGVTF